MAFEGEPVRQRKTLPMAGGEEQLQQFPNPRRLSEIDPRESKELFAEAQASIVSEKMFQTFVRAIVEKETTGSNDTLVLVQNRIIQACVNLSPENIRLLLDQFNREVQKWFIKKYGPQDVDERVYQSISTGGYTHGQKNIDTQGVQSVISFLQQEALAREESHQEYAFYFNPRLDARHKIDVIEEVRKSDAVLEIKLVQLKSSLPSEEDLEKIYSDHCEWAEEGWIDLERYEETYTGQDGTAEEVSVFLTNQAEVENALLDFSTNPEGQDLQNLVAALHLADLSGRQKAWILWKYFDLIAQQLDLAEQHNAVDAPTREFIISSLSALKTELEAKAKLPKAQSVVGRIQSVVAVGSRIIPGSERDIITERNKVINIH